MQTAEFYCGREVSLRLEFGGGGGSDVGDALCDVVGEALCDVVGTGSARGASGTVVMALSGFNR